MTDRLLFVLAVDSDDLEVTNYGEMPEHEAEVAAVDIRRGEDMADWKAEDAWGTFAAAVEIDDDDDMDALINAVVGVHIAERFPERWLSHDRRFRVPES